MTEQTLFNPNRPATFDPEAFADYRAELIVEPDGSRIIAFDFGPRTIGIVEIDRDDGRTMELWHDHRHSGAGANNWRFDAFGRELDLEFFSSREAYLAELTTIDQLKRASA